MKALAAMNHDRVIGKQNTIPWRSKEDMQWFKKMTMHGTVVMGRKTFESLGWKPLPGRENIVVHSRYQIDGVHNVHSCMIEDGIKAVIHGRECETQLNSEVWLIGGAQLYAALLPKCSEVFLTLFDHKVEDGDTFMPQFEHLFHHVGVIKEIEHGKIHHYVNKNPKV